MGGFTSGCFRFIRESSFFEADPSQKMKTYIKKRLPLIVYSTLACYHVQRRRPSFITSNVVQTFKQVLKSLLKAEGDESSERAELNAVHGVREQSVEEGLSVFKYSTHAHSRRGEDTDISTAAQLVDDCRMELSVLKTDEVFVEMWDEAETDASKVFVYRRERRRRKLLKRPED
ncbi:Hypothetical predicted protein [Scomber scombrus]|uniref:Uncharacterized protein n=1 Tax=Scomber scombrus TaxID=13677 RepID=A0AAV1P6Q0_SCOSC